MWSGNLSLTHKLRYPSRYPFYITTEALPKPKCVISHPRELGLTFCQTLRGIVQESGRILAHAFKLEITEPTFLDLTRYVA